MKFLFIKFFLFNIRRSVQKKILKKNLINSSLSRLLSLLTFSQSLFFQLENIEPTIYWLQ